MIFLKRRRLIFWLIRAYLKRWRKTILISFVLGLVVFFILRFGVNYFIPLLPFTQQKTIGMVGSYTADELPPTILSKVSSGLTYIDSQGYPRPAIAKSWEIKNNGKTYIFHLRNNVYFSDGTKLTSSEIHYNFLDTSVQRPDPYTIIYNLKSNYAPFLVTVSRPVFKSGFVGTGDYRVQSIDLNGDFVQSINLVSTKGQEKEFLYEFYPTEDALKTAFVMGDVSQISGVKNTSFENNNLTNFSNVSYVKSIDYTQLVTLFFNTQDSDLSDKRIREALSYTIPDTLSYGRRNYTPYAPNSWASQYALNALTIHNQDLQHAKLLLSESLSSSQSSALKLEIQTLDEYKDLAYQIQAIWEKLGIKTNVRVVSGMPSNFQIFLGAFNVPQDPDQYTLWHSSQINNITNYKNLRIDKLLEDGRQTVSVSQRENIYADFQKYFLDDPPAVFLYFPYVYDITRK